MTKSATKKISLIPSGKEQARLKRRHRKETLFRYSGGGAIALAFIFLALLMASIITRGLPAFTETRVRLSVDFSPELLELPENFQQTDLASGNYDALIHAALKNRFPGVEDRNDVRQLYSLVSQNAGYTLQNMVAENPAIIGTTRDVWLLVASDISMLVKGTIDRNLPPEMRRVSDQQIAWTESLESAGSIKHGFNHTFFSHGDSREPEQAGILGAVLGSFFTIIVCMAVAFPVGVITAVYLEEFAPKNKLMDLIEVNINNLAAVPSIVFGLLGLAVFLNFFGLPRGSSIVGGLTLSLMILPTIIIATRNSLKSVPPSIRQAAMGLGASPIQVVTHHVLPLAMPGVMTGAILGIARAMGETAPLLMIGMVAFVADVPTGFSSPASVMPVQIYLWSDNPEMGFQEKTSAAIIILLVILITANAVATWLRKKYERKW